MIGVFDALNKVLFDDERNVEYPSWQSLTDDALIKRSNVLGATKVIWPVTASQKFNSEIAVSLQNALVSKRLELPVSFQAEEDSLRNIIPEYFETTDADLQAYLERPYFETTALINEMIELEYEVLPSTGLVSLKERGKNRKDRYTALAYGNYYADLLQRDLLANRAQYVSRVFIN